MSTHESYACKRLSDQIKFFGAKPKRFVSIYAKKPRIRLKIKDDTESIIIADTLSYNLRRRQREASQLAAQQYNSASQAFLQQQSMRENIGLSNIGQANANNSLTGGLGIGLGASMFY